MYSTHSGSDLQLGVNSAFLAITNAELAPRSALIKLMLRQRRDDPSWTLIVVNICSCFTLAN